MPTIISSSTRQRAATPISVLFVHYGDEWVRGSEILLLDLLRALDRTRFQPVVWCNGGHLAALCQDAGWVTYTSKFEFYLDYRSPKINLNRYISLLKMARELCRRHQVQIVHANSAAPAQWLVPVGLHTRIPILVHLHTEYLRRSRFVLLLHSASHVVGVSQHVLNGLLVDGMPAARTQVILNGIDFSRFSRSGVDLRDTLNIPHEAFVVASAGSLIHRKGHDVLLRAFNALPSLSSCPPHLIIAGDGPERERLYHLAASLGLSGRVHMMGHLDQLAPVYETADVFALASRGDAFGLVLAEAAYFGLPVVSTRVGGIPEVVVHEGTGLLTGPEDVGEFSNALLRVMSDRSLRTRLAASAVARARSLFTSERMAQQFEATYSELVTRPHREFGWFSGGNGVAPLIRFLRSTSNRAP